MIIGKWTGKECIMIRSIRFKMTVVLILILGGVLFFAYIMNSLFAEQYYVDREKRNLLDAYHQIDTAMKEGEDSGNLDNVIEDLSMESNIKILALQISGNILSLKGNKANLRDDDRMYEAMFGYLQTIYINKDFHEWMFEEDQEVRQEIIKSLSESEDVADQEICKLIKEGCFITDMRDRRGSDHGLYLFGCNRGKYLLAMRIPLADIQDSAAISRQLMLRIGLLGILIGSIIMFSYASTFTKPIKEIAAASEEMAHLNFDVKVRTDRKDELGMLGHSINSMSEQLEHTIADLKTANVELLGDIEKKEQIDEMRKDFLSHVSHELKTPIALIQGYAEGLKENINDDQESRDFYCDVISDEAMKMNTMVRKLLNLNQIEFGNNALDIRRFDLCQMISNKIAASKILFEKKKAQVDFLEEAPEYVWADELMIEEAFSNYLSNALNHVREGGRIRIWFEKNEKDLRLHVVNQGSLIPEEDLDKVWIKFYKVDKARTREYGGNGIGLSLVAATLEAHGKAYGVNNLEDGVDFWFDLDRENA